MLCGQIEGERDRAIAQPSITTMRHAHWTRPGPRDQDQMRALNRRDKRKKKGKREPLGRDATPFDPVGEPWVACEGRGREAAQPFLSFLLLDFLHPFLHSFISVPFILPTLPLLCTPCTRTPAPAQSTFTRPLTSPPRQRFDSKYVPFFILDATFHSITSSLSNHPSFLLAFIDMPLTLILGGASLPPFPGWQDSQQ